jgi:predicted MFS family arabinose efflux permease
MEQTVGAIAPRVAPGPVRATLAALCANLVGIGIARFGYTPLLPAVIAAGWFSPSTAAYLGAANLAGYLAGALGVRALAARFGAVISLQAAMLLTAASLFACAFPVSFAWFFAWRFLSGGTGGVLMALAAPTVIAAIPPGRRGIAGGAIFTGVGIGIAASGTLIPLLIRWGLVETWLGLGAVTLVLTAICWSFWPSARASGTSASRPTVLPAPRAGAATAALRALYLEYALNAVGLVPHMVFLVDYVARGLGRGLHAGSLCWIVFGAGAVVGPLLAGHAGDRIGFRAALRAAFLIQAAFVAVPLVTTSSAALLLSSFVVGAFVPGIVAITLGRTRELLPDDLPRQAAAWGYCTTAFAIGQAVAGYGFSFIFATAREAYAILFALAGMILLVALAVDLLVPLAIGKGAR